jgi:hypothetical protein
LKFVHTDPLRQRDDEFSIAERCPIRQLVIVAFSRITGQILNKLPVVALGVMEVLTLAVRVIAR